MNPRPAALSTPRWCLTAGCRASTLALLMAVAGGCGDDETSAGTGGGGGASGAATSSSSASTTSVSTTVAGSSSSGSAGGQATGTGGAGGDAGAGGAGGGAGDAEPLEPGFALVDLAMPIDLTSDGRVALIQDPGSLEGDVYLYDVATEELTLATSLGDALADFATGLSDELDVSALHGVPVQAGVWSPSADWTDLESPFAEGCDINIGGAWDVSRDGGVVVGFFWDACSPQAFRKEGGAVPVLLERLGSTLGPGQPINRASVVSDDGLVAAGFAENEVLDRSAAVWPSDGPAFFLDPAGQDAPSEVLAISRDGSVLGGILGFDGFQWTEAGGMQVLPRLDTALPSDRVFVNATTGDGAFLFGASGDAFSGIPIAFVWSEADGTRPLQDLAVAAGITLPDGFILGNVLAASADGAVLLGTGLDVDFVTRTFVLRLPVGALGG